MDNARADNKKGESVANRVRVSHTHSEQYLDNIIWKGSAKTFEQTMAVIVVYNIISEPSCTHPRFASFYITYVIST